MSNDGRTIEITDVGSIERDQEWRAAVGVGGLPVLADVASTTHYTLRGKYTLRWYRRHPGAFDSDRRLIWRSADGGTPAPTAIAAALDAALMS